jgi:hypothetical protein
MSIKPIKRSLLSLAVLCSVLFACSVANGAVSFMLAPPRVERTVRPRSIVKIPLTVVTDPSEETAYFRFYVLDFRMSENGQVEYSEAGSTKRSASPWIELESREFQVQAGERREIEMTIRVPSAASGGYYSAVILEALPLEAMRSGKRLLRTLRMVSLVELTVRGRGRVKERADISDMVVDRVPGSGQIRFTVDLMNSGDIHVRGKGQVLVKTLQGSRIGTAELEAGRGTVLPDQVRVFTGTLDRGMSDGNYVAEATLTYGPRGKATAKIPFSVSGGKLSAVATLEEDLVVRFLVDPYLVDVSASPGAFRTVPILIENEDDAAIQVTARAKDVSFDLDGVMTVSEPSGGDRTCAAWIEISPSEFMMRPRDRRRVMAKISVPKDAEGGYATQLDFMASVAEGEAKQAKPGIAGTTLLVTTQGDVSKKGEISEVDISQSGRGKPIRFAVSVKNNGNTHLEPTGSVRVYQLVDGSPGRVIGEIPFDEIYDVVLPGGTRRLRASLPGDLLSGRLRAEITVGVGGESALTETRDFSAR